MKTSEFTQETEEIIRKLNSSLWEAVERNDIEMIKDLINPLKNDNHCANINAPGLNNWTSLHMAAAYGLKEACEILIFHGKDANINARTSMNRTPLHLATIYNHLNVIKLLVHQKALLNVVDNDMNTPLHYASNQGYENIVEWFLRKNPDLVIRNYRGRTSTDIALNYQTYLLFIEYCAKMNVELPVTGYTRSVIYDTLLHNSREDQINKILTKCMTKPNLNAVKVFSDRPKLEIQKPKKKFINFSKFVLPSSNVGPQDFRGLLQLGKGSFGEVYLVEKKDTLEQFALKVLRKEEVLKNDLLTYAFAERNILMRIEHPFIVKLNYAFQTPEKLIMIMDFCPNGDLGSQLARDKKFSEDKAKFYLIEVLLALQELHNHNIIYRDLKPENVVLDSEGHARLTDFGLAKEGANDEQVSRSFCGSVAYLAPEMLKKAGHTRSIDWYLLGVLLYEMLIGVPPYLSQDEEELFKNIQKGKLKISKSVSKEARRLIKQLMRKNPNKRLGSSKKDAEDVKSDPFFNGVDWSEYLAKKIPPPSFHVTKRVLNEVSLDVMFGELEDEYPVPKFDGWSILKSTWFIFYNVGLVNTIILTIIMQRI